MFTITWLIRCAAVSALALLLITCPAYAETLHVTATAYSSEEPGIGEIGALGHPIRAHKTIAVSRDLRHLLGQEVYIHGLGYRFVNDLMAARWTNRIDLVRETVAECEEWGKRKMVMLTGEEM